MKRILFVDDEQAALDGLRYRLHRMSSKWQVDCVDNGPRAIEQMQRQPYDVIVTDMRMPGMDGAELLEIVSGRWPQAVRIVLSGYADLKQTIRLVPFAHQYLSKPCEPRQLEQVIDRCLLLHDMLHGSHLRTIVGRIRKLPSLPRRNREGSDPGGPTDRPAGRDASHASLTIQPSFRKIRGLLRILPCSPVAQR